MTSTHYSDAHNPRKLKAWAEKTANVLLPIIQGSPTPLMFCYRGMSGVAVTTALSLALQNLREKKVKGFTKIRFEFAYVRKPNEKSHGVDVECSRGYYGLRRPHRYILVDDFIDSGSTMTSILKKIRSEANDGEIKFSGAVLGQKCSMIKKMPRAKREKHFTDDYFEISSGVLR